jgi:hypothetical protein
VREGGARIRGGPQLGAGSRVVLAQVAEMLAAVRGELRALAATDSTDQPTTHTTEEWVDS